MSKRILPMIVLFWSAVVLLGATLLQSVAAAQSKPAAAMPTRIPGAIPSDLMLRFLQLEDERNLNGEELTKLLFHAVPAVRARAALAVGRIGDKRATAALLAMLEKESNAAARAMAAFALGEIEDAQAMSALLAAIARKDEKTNVQARAIEAVGKIGSQPANAEILGKEILEKANAAILSLLPEPQAALAPEQKQLTSLAISALMRLRNPAVVMPLTGQLKSIDAQIRAAAANALYRLRLPLEKAIPALAELLSDKDAAVRANAVRALGQAQGKMSSDRTRAVFALLNDTDGNVQVNAMRAALALAGAKNDLMSMLLGMWCDQQRNTLGASRGPSFLELELALGASALKGDQVTYFIYDLRRATGIGAFPEIETALAKLDEGKFLAPLQTEKGIAFGRWQQAANVAQGLAEIKLAGTAAQQQLFVLLRQTQDNKVDARCLPAILRALAKHKPGNLAELLRRHLAHQDVIVRATAAGLAEAIPSDEMLQALLESLLKAKSDRMNDARLAILSALAKYKEAKAAAAIEAAMEDQDYLVRRHAAGLLMQPKGEKSEAKLSEKTGIVSTGHDAALYQRVLKMSGTKPQAVIHTKRGLITLELFADEAPLTVDNFVTLARKGFFNGLTFHRVVPNFVIQGGDPRADGEGGPGYQIRCEINQQPYKRGTVGMALSGKDTGGSQFFITHAPQPHLDGGYTVFGQVVTGMEVVDQITRGDVIEKIIIVLQ
jgi:cyclophilin family peptidyl-prolyl cis-trans isomerase/HEAT repeat protein